MTSNPLFCRLLCLDKQILYIYSPPALNIFFISVQLPLPPSFSQIPTRPEHNKLLSVDDSRYHLPLYFGRQYVQKMGFMHSFVTNQVNFVIISVLSSPNPYCFTQDTQYFDVWINLCLHLLMISLDILVISTLRSFPYQGIINMVIIILHLAYTLYFIAKWKHLHNPCMTSDQIK